MEITLSIKQIIKYIIILIGVLVFVHLVLQTIQLSTANSQLFGLIDRFDLDSEISVPTWLSQIYLFIASVLLFIIALYNKKISHKFSKHWFGLAWIFLYLSLDEGAMLHELLIDPMKQLLNISSGALGFAWVIPFAVLFIIIALIYFPFIQHLPKKFKRLFLLSGIVYVFGALVIEMVGGKILTFNIPHYYYLLCVGTEELLEMIGIALFIYALLTYIKEILAKPIRVHIS